jgi:hypothetical protein
VMEGWGWGLVAEREPSEATHWGGDCGGVGSVSSGGTCLRSVRAVAMTSQICAMSCFPTSAAAYVKHENGDI